MHKIIITIYLIWAVLGFSEFDVLNNLKVPESIGQFSKEPNLKFVLPNESYPGAFKKDLVEETGFMVSVGTFRTLITFAWGPNITHLLMADINPQIVTFNKDHLALIRCISEKYKEYSDQRQQYIAHMKRQVKEGEDNCYEIIKNSKPLTYVVQSIIENPKESFLGLKKVDNELFYWENDILWQKITNAIKENRIAATRLDLSLLGDLKALSEFIKNSRLILSVLDFSNVHEYLKSLDKWSRDLLESDLRAKKVFMTAMNEREFLKKYLVLSHKQIEDFWDYFVLLWEEFIASLKTNV